jgi:hypothetical protein
MPEKVSGLNNAERFIVYVQLEGSNPSDSIKLITKNLNNYEN